MGMTGAILQVCLPGLELIVADLQIITLQDLEEAVHDKSRKESYS